MCSNTSIRNNLGLQLLELRFSILRCLKSEGCRFWATQVSLSELYIALDEGETGGIVRCMAALGMDFSALGGGAAEPALVAKMAAIMFDTR